MSKLFSFFFKEKTSLEIVLNLLKNRPINNIADTNATSDCAFYIGSSHTLKFSSQDIECVLFFNGEEVPMFVFDDPADVSAIREFVINKLDPTLSPNSLLT